MIRRTTWILVAVFGLLLAAAIFLSKSPSAQNLLQTETPTATVEPAMLADWPVDRVNKIEFQSVVSTFVLERSGNGGWTLAGQEGQVDAGQVEMLLSSLSSVEVIQVLDPSTPLDATGLETPSAALTLTSQDGDSKVLSIGNLSPTESGYYLRIDGEDIVLVRKSSWEEIVSLLSVDQLLIVSTGTPPASEGTPSP